MIPANCSNTTIHVSNEQMEASGEQLLTVGVGVCRQGEKDQNDPCGTAMELETSV